MSSLCTLLGYTRQAFYGYRQHWLQEVFEAEIIVQQVLKHRGLQPRLGTRKLLVMMQDFVKEHHIALGRDGLFNLLREHDLLIRKRKRKARTTFSKHWYKKYKNLMRSFESLAPNLLWVSDITYIVVSDGFAYLSLITDAYSKKIMGFYLSKTLEAIKASISRTGLSAATWSSTVAKQVCWRCCPCINCIPFYCKNHTALKLLTLCVYL